MYEADAINIDDVFVRYFHMDSELEDDNSDEIICHIEFETDYTPYEFFFTAKELEGAIPNRGGEGWLVNNGGNSIIITPYKLTELKG